MQNWQFLELPPCHQFLGSPGTLLTKGGGFAAANDGHIIAVSAEWSSIITLDDDDMDADMSQPTNDMKYMG